ncbi:hypothetical protein GEMRC1_007217 [Eukaryota sp. GEM-RC1]
MSDSPRNESELINDDASRPKLDDRAKLKFLRTEFKKLQADMASVTTLNDSLTDENAQLKTDIEELRNAPPPEPSPCQNCTQYEREISDLQEKISNLSSQTAEIPVLKSSLEETESDLYNQRKSNDELSETVHNLKSENASLLEENKQLKSDIENLSTDKDSLQNQVSHLESQSNRPTTTEVEEPETPHAPHLSHLTPFSDDIGSKNALGKPPRTDGWLSKVGLFRKNWKNRFFRLRISAKHGVIMSYFKTEFCPATLALGVFTVPKGGVKVVDDVERYGRSFVFEVTTNDRTFVCQAASVADREHWVQTIENALEWHDAYSSAKAL